MGVLSSQELARTFENEVGGQPRAVRTWAVTLTDDTLFGNGTSPVTVLTALGLTDYGALHPDFTSNAFFGLRKVTVNERFQDSPYHIQVVAEYGVVTANEVANPTARANEWTFEGQASEVPALFWWDGTTKRPLVNSAYDYFEGLTTTEQLVKATVKMNLTDWASLLPKIQANHKINSDGYLGCDPHTWKVAGVTTAFTIEIYNNVAHEYWATTCELLYRESGWNLYLPDVGWNYIDGGQKRRAMVFDFENGEWVASANPVGLTSTGALNMTTWPNILERRVNREAVFVSLFGLPPGAT